jgi:hypothetical protein
MKVIEFIKRNISVFNVISLLLLFFILKEFLFYNSFEDPYGLKILFIIFVLFLIFIVLIIDIFFKKYIKSRLKLNILELVITFIFFQYFLKFLFNGLFYFFN